MTWYGAAGWAAVGAEAAVATGGATALRPHADSNTAPNNAAVAERRKGNMEVGKEKRNEVQLGLHQVK
ncbi:hypothetical protein D3Y59_10070 [Hymenobacter oligotrophus]|uniref:Uncharacterized protein n=1 Tax=Hymenobacter oligotrophus TaxID=2319843 RepID=A0A3B7R0A6_9BACT|nr:hypothetical protein D3Y59_10070 [Hymenobacter oligotrophus]